jgi:hypothetical protein
MITAKIEKIENSLAEFNALVERDMRHAGYCRENPTGDLVEFVARRAMAEDRLTEDEAVDAAVFRLSSDLTFRHNAIAALKQRYLGSLFGGT